MSKRNIFSEIQEGFEALKAQRESKVTLRTHRVQTQPMGDITAADIIQLRETLRLSRAVLADHLRTNPRTLESWEQGRAKPNAQAVLLLRMVQEFPDTIDRLRKLA